MFLPLSIPDVVQFISSADREFQRTHIKLFTQHWLG
jgi:hypothetical protein